RFVGGSGPRRYMSVLGPAQLFRERAHPRLTPAAAGGHVTARPLPCVRGCPAAGLRRLPCRGVRGLFAVGGRPRTEIAYSRPLLMSHPPAEVRSRVDTSQ